MKSLDFRDLVHDVLISLLFGLLLACGLALILLLAGLLLNGFDFRSALVVVRGGLFIAGAAELLISAGVILTNKDSRKVRNYGQWKRRFQVFGLIPVLLLSAVVVLTAGSIVDYYLYF